jgi:hypothetical protein
LKAILKLCNLIAHHEDNLIYVFGQEEYPQDDLQIGVFHLDFISATEIMPIVQTLP